MANETKQKIQWEMLAPSLQKRITDLEDKESINRINSNQNNTDVSGLANQISNKITSIEGLKSTSVSKYTAAENALTAYKGKPYDIGRNVLYAKKYGLKGQMLKADETLKNRLVPNDGFIVMRLCNIANQEEKLSHAVADANEKFAFNYENQSIYYYKASTSHWVLYDPFDSSLLYFLYNVFVLDPITGETWYFKTPKERIYLWTTDVTNLSSKKIADTSATPRDQDGVEVIPKDIGEGSMNTVDNPLTTKNLIGISAANVLRKTQHFEIQTLLGATYYYEGNTYFTNDSAKKIKNEYSFSFNVIDNGHASLTLTFSWNGYKGKHLDSLDKVIAEYNTKGEWDVKSKGIIHVYFTPLKKTSYEEDDLLGVVEVDDNFMVWTKVVEYEVESLDKGDYKLIFTFNSEPYNHLLINHISFTIGV